MAEFERIANGVSFLKIPFGPVFTGVALIEGDVPILIDSGAAASDVDGILLPALAKAGVDPRKAILTCTHTHGDHTGGFARLRETGIGEIVCFEGSKPKIEDPVPYAVATRTRFPAYSPAPQTHLRPVRVDKTLKDGEKLGGRLRLIHTPGHDDDCVCFFDEKTGILFTGDSLQANGTPAQGIGFYKSLPDYRRTLEKIAALPLKAIQCGHDYDGIGCFIAGEEAAARALRFCRGRVETYGAFVAAHRGEDPAAIAEKLIEKEGCGKPPHLFMALYTVTEHLKEVEKHG